MEKEEPTFRHYKTGNIYTVITDQAIRETDLKRLVVYRDHKGNIWVRLFEDFHALVEPKPGRIVPRFEAVTLLADKTGPCEPGCCDTQD